MLYVFLIFSLLLTLNVNASQEEDLDIWAGNYKVKIQATELPPGLCGAPTLYGMVTTPYNHLWVSYGNASGYTFTKVYSLKNGLKFIMSLRNRGAPVVKGKYLHFVDGSFGAWFKMFPAAWYGPEPKMIYAFKDGKYQVAAKMMKKKPLSAKALKQKVQAILYSPDFKDRMVKREEPDGNPDHFAMVAGKNIYSHPLYWETIFDLVYSGNMKQALEVIRKVQAAEGLQNAEDCIKDFKAILETSPYWAEVKKV